MRNPSQTRVIELDANSPETAAIADAAAVIVRGGLVAFPTETVYGLGANALDPAAVQRIFAAKGRPPDNPLIVHTADVTGARALVAEWPEVAQRLADAFWPGPLSIILPRLPHVPDVVTGGGATVGIRVPRHPVAQALIRTANVPIAAPSANLSAQVSPTRPAHVLAGLQGRIELLLAAGPTPGGLESTVIDVSGPCPRILRLGLVTPGQLHEVIGPVEIAAGPSTSTAPDGPSRSPGTLQRHYAPLARLLVAPDDGLITVRDLLRAKKRIGWLCFEDAQVLSDADCVQVPLPRDAPRYAAQFYAALHDLDAAGVDWIVAARPPAAGDWLAIHDRLSRASFQDG